MVYLDKTFLTLIVLEHFKAMVLTVFNGLLLIRVVLLKPLTPGLQSCNQWNAIVKTWKFHCSFQCKSSKEKKPHIRWTIFFCHSKSNAWSYVLVLHFFPNWRWYIWCRKLMLNLKFSCYCFNKTIWIFLLITC